MSVFTPPLLLNHWYFPAFKKIKNKTTQETNSFQAGGVESLLTNKCWKNPGWQSLCPPLQSVKISPIPPSGVPSSLLSCRSDHVSSAKDTARSIWWIKHGVGFGWRGPGRKFVWAKTSQSVEKRSPAEGSGARPPVTLGRSERSGRLWMWDFSSFLTWVTLASFCLYSCRGQHDTAQIWAKKRFLIYTTLQLSWNYFTMSCNYSFLTCLKHMLVTVCGFNR